MIAAIGACALLSMQFTGPTVEAMPMPPVAPAVSDTQTPFRSPSALLILVNADGTIAGEMKSRQQSSLVEIQVFKENTATDSQLRVEAEEKEFGQSFIWMRNLAVRMLERANAKSRNHPCSTVTGFDQVVIVREVTAEEAESTEPVEQRAERAITDIFGA